MVAGRLRGQYAECFRRLHSSFGCRQQDLDDSFPGEDHVNRVAGFVLPVKQQIDAGNVTVNEATVQEPSAASRSAPHEQYPCPASWLTDRLALPRRQPRCHRRQRESIRALSSAAIARNTVDEFHGSTA